MSSDFDQPPAPSYSDTQNEALASYLATNPQYRDIAVRQELGTYLPASTGANDAKYQSLQTEANRRQQVLGDLIAKYQKDGVVNYQYDPAYLAAQNSLYASQREVQNYKQANKYYGAGDLGNVDVAKAYGLAALDLGDEQARRQLALRQELGVQTIRQSNAELQAADPIAWAGNQALKTQLYKNAQDAQNDLGNLPQMQADAMAAYKLGIDPNYNDLKTRAAGNMANLGASALGKLRDDALADYNLGSTLDASTRAEVEQAARAAQAARGNILGNAAAYTEAMQLGSAGEARKQQRIANLSALEGQYNAQDAQNMAALGQYTSAADAAKDRLTNNVYTAEGNLAGRKQQNQANIQNILLGTPLSAQYSTLGSAGTGSVAYNPFIGNQSATPANGNAGSQYSLGVYNQQSQNANAANAAGNPWMNMATGIIGNFAGAYTGGLGSGLATKTLAA